jgi:hypothetical protein
MRQTIATRYSGPTNHRGSKCLAASNSGHRLIVEWDDALNSDQNHIAAAQALAQKLGWSGTWHGGDCFSIARANHA